jgi:hypothetical protein
MPVLFAVAPINPDDAMRVPLRFCNIDDPAVTGLNDTRWWPGIGRAPALNREAFNGSFSDSVAIPNGVMTLFLNALVKVDPQAPYYRYAGAPVNVWYGPHGGAWEDYQKIFTGLVTDYSLEASQLRMTCTVDSEPFEADVLSLKYGGGGDADGTEDLKDKPKPMCFGYARNVEPVMINTVDNVFQVHAYGPVEDIVMVYERALAFDASVGDFPSYAALVAADIAEGEWGTCLAEGMFRLGAPPFGLITADVKGDNSGGWHRTTAAIIRRLCEIAEVDPARIDDASLDAFEADCPEPINLYLVVSTTLFDLLQELALPCNAQASLSWTGLLQVTRFGAMPDTPALTLDAQGRQLPPVIDNSEQNVSPPYWRLEMNAEPCWRVQSKDEIVFEDEFGQVTVYRRYPTKPPKPTGDGVPEGWSGTPPTGYAAPENIDGFDQFGPVWQSISFQALHGKLDDNGWSDPVLFDVGYQGWNLASQNTGAKVLGNVNGLKATSDFDPELDVWPYCFIKQPITGPFRLKAKVKGVGDRVAIGVIPYTPEVVDGGFGWTPDPIHLFGDIKDGFWVAQNDPYAVFEGSPPTYTPVTGVFIFQEYDPTLGLVPKTASRLLTTPPADCIYEMVFNGATIDHYINNELVRTHFINTAFEALNTYWPVFIPASPDAEIYEIEWSRASQGSNLEFPVDDERGPLRQMKDEKGWEVYAPEIPSGISIAELDSKLFYGAATAKARIQGLTGSGSQSSFGLGGIGHITFYGSGLFQCYREIDASPSATGTWALGDEFTIDCDGEKTTFLQNGASLRRRYAKLTSRLTGFFLTFGAGGAFSDISVIPTRDGQLQVLGQATNTALLTPIDDTTTTITGGWIVLGTTPDIVFTNASSDGDEVAVAANVTYTKTAGAAANVKLTIQLQKSVDQGANWTDLGTGATGGLSTGTTSSVQDSETDTISGDGTVRYRLLAKNATAGTYTATIGGTLAAKWNG